MPFSKDNLENLPSSTKNLTKIQKEKFVDVFNALVESGMEEEAAVPVAITRAKSRKKVKKNNFQVLKATDDEQMIAVEVVYEPNKLDAHDQWMSASTIRKACENFNKNLTEGKIASNLFHVADTEDFTIQKTWINECECYIGDQYVPEGTWISRIQYHNTNLWKAKKAGDILGVSIRGSGVIKSPVGKE